VHTNSVQGQIFLMRDFHFPLDQKHEYNAISAKTTFRSRQCQIKIAMICLIRIRQVWCVTLTSEKNFQNILKISTKTLRFCVETYIKKPCFTMLLDRRTISWTAKPVKKLETGLEKIRNTCSNNIWSSSAKILNSKRKVLGLRRRFKMIEKQQSTPKGHLN